MINPGFEAEIFDVFLCHNSEDKPAVREIFWLQHHYLLPLLDGLDEVETTLQSDCVGAINAFIEEANPQDSWFVVGSTSIAGSLND